MPHQVHQRKFGREGAHRRAMLRNLTLSVLRYERVKTTEAKAKEVRGLVDRIIGLGKDGSLASRRRARAFLPEPGIVEKVFSELAPRYPDRRSGYVRLTRLGHRVGDSAPQMLLELMPGVEKAPPAEGQAEQPRKRRIGLPRRRPAPARREPEAAEQPTSTAKRGAGAKKAAAPKTTKKKSGA